MISKHCGQDKILSTCYCSSYTFRNIDLFVQRTYDALRQDFEWVEQQGLCFGIKIVRGAYIEWERKNALLQQIEGQWDRFVMTPWTLSHLDAFFISYVVICP